MIDGLPKAREVWDGLSFVAKRIFGPDIPHWLGTAVAWVLLLSILVGLLLAIVAAVARIKEHVRDIAPSLYDPDTRRRNRRRKRFAGHVEAEIRRLNNLESWEDFRFAELEAEVEAEGARRGGIRALASRRGLSGLRREKSLSVALRATRERIVLLEGDPGSGKSVALRHVALSFSRKVNNSWFGTGRIPIYINLKEFAVSPDQATSESIRSFVLQCANRGNSRDVESFLDDEFDRGLEEGRWIFLFDSFDEIPAILSATEAGGIVRKYAEAIEGFLGGLGACRGVVASRLYRGPTTSGWPTFRILQLSNPRQRELIRRADLTPTQEMDVLRALFSGSSDMRTIGTNPMFLGLLCEHVRTAGAIPSHSHGIFESYVNRRLQRDEDRLARRYGTSGSELRHSAEMFAFAMASTDLLGLSPSRSDLKSAVQVLLTETELPLDRQMDALEYLRLARSESADTNDGGRLFTFAHRRFQEYFATCVVCREPSRVPVQQLLTDARWRETAVVLCQTQAADAVELLLDAAAILLGSAEAEVTLALDAASVDGGISPIPWPASYLHVLSLLQDGFEGRYDVVPNETRNTIGRVLSRAMVHGTLQDKKYAVDVAGTAPMTSIAAIVHWAFRSRSEWLADSAFRQVSRIAMPSQEINSYVCSWLLKLFRSGRMHRDRVTIEAHLARVQGNDEMTGCFRFLRWATTIDAITLAIGAAAVTQLTALEHAMTPRGWALQAGLIWILCLLPLTPMLEDVTPFWIAMWRYTAIAVLPLALMGRTARGTNVVTDLIQHATSSPQADISPADMFQHLMQNGRPLWMLGVAIIPVVWTALGLAAINSRSMIAVRYGLLAPPVFGVKVLGWRVARVTGFAFGAVIFGLFILRSTLVLLIVLGVTAALLLVLIGIVTFVRAAAARRWFQDRRVIRMIRSPSYRGGAIEPLLRQCASDRGRAAVLERLRYSGRLASDDQTASALSRIGLELDARIERQLAKRTQMKNSVSERELSFQLEYRDEIYRSLEVIKGPGRVAAGSSDQVLTETRTSPTA